MQRWTMHVSSNYGDCLLPRRSILLMNFLKGEAQLSQRKPVRSGNPSSNERRLKLEPSTKSAQHSTFWFIVKAQGVLSLLCIVRFVESSDVGLRRSGFV